MSGKRKGSHPMRIAPVAPPALGPMAVHVHGAHAHAHVEAGAADGDDDLIFVGVVPKRPKHAVKAAPAQGKRSPAQEKREEQRRQQELKSQASAPLSLAAPAGAIGVARMTVAVDSLAIFRGATTIAIATTPQAAGQHPVGARLEIVQEGRTDVVPVAGWDAVWPLALEGIQRALLAFWAGPAPGGIELTLGLTARALDSETVPHTLSLLLLQLFPVWAGTDGITPNDVFDVARTKHADHVSDACLPVTTVNVH